MYRQFCWDSRHVTPGSVFIALPGHRTDGHLFLEEALARGAAGFVVQQDRVEQIPRALRPLIVAAVPDTRLALAQLAADFFRHPSRRLFTVGITGTNGKTTLAHLLAHLWNGARPRPRPGGGCGVIGTLCTRTGLRQYPARLTTPEAPDLQASLAEMVATGLAAAAMEVSSQGIAQRRISGTRFSLAALTQISPDHSDLHPSFEAYRRIKLGFLLQQPPRIPLVLNRDDPHAAQFLSLDAHPERTFTYGWDERSDVWITDARCYRGGLHVELRPSVRVLEWAAARADWSPGRWGRRPRWRWHSPLLGRHNAHNVAAATLMALLCGIHPPSIEAGLHTFRGTERRMQLYPLRGRTVLDDTALNPASYEAAFTTATELNVPRSGGRYILVSAIRGHRGPDINRQNAAVIAQWASKMPLRRIILTDSAEATDDGDRVKDEEREAALAPLRALSVPWEHHRWLLPALEAAWFESRVGDMILLLGAQGMDPGWSLLQELASPGARASSGAKRGYDRTPS